MNELTKRALRLSPDLAAALNVVDSHLLSAAEIAANAVEAVDGYSGIYFLLDGSDIVYIGQSTKIYARIGQHVAECWHPTQAPWTKKFTHATVLMCPRAHLDTLEAAYIRKFKPKYNRSLNGRSSGAGSGMIAVREKEGKAKPVKLDASGNSLEELVQLVRQYS